MVKVMSELLYGVFLLLETFIYLCYIIRVFSLTTDEYAKKTNVTNRDYCIALVKRMFMYPYLTLLGIVLAMLYFVYCYQPLLNILYLNAIRLEQVMHIDMLILFLEFAVMTLFILMIGYPLLLIEYILKVLNLG